MGRYKEKAEGIYTFGLRASELDRLAVSEHGIPLRRCHHDLAFFGLAGMFDGDDAILLFGFRTHADAAFVNDMRAHANSAGIKNFLHKDPFIWPRNAASVFILKREGNIFYQKYLRKLALLYNKFCNYIDKIVVDR